MDIQLRRDVANCPEGSYNPLEIVRTLKEGEIVDCELAFMQEDKHGEKYFHIKTIDGPIGGQKMMVENRRFVEI